MLAALAVEGRALEPLRLLALGGFLDSVDETRDGHPPRRPAPSSPSKPLPDRAASFKRETAHVRDKIDPSGEVVDHASPELKLIRERLRKQRTRLRGTLESYLRGKDTAKYLQDQVVTERNGRYVLVVKAEHRSVDSGHRARRVDERRQPVSRAAQHGRNQQRHRRPLEQEIEEDPPDSARADRRVSARARPICARTIDAATELDVLQARARFSDSVDGVEPALSDGAFELQAARHPLREGGGAGHHQNHSARQLPADHRSEHRRQDRRAQDSRTARADGAGGTADSGGRRIAAAGVPVGVRRYRRRAVDRRQPEHVLGAHHQHRGDGSRPAVPALVLLDEVGSGTDPIEGGALGVAIVDHFRRRGATVIATSHYDALKTYASTTDGVTCAAFGFDPETFAPTYQLLYGSPGRSLALEIAARLGLNPSIVAAARQNLSAREAQLAEHLAKIDRDMRALEHEHRLAARERETLGAAEARMRQREEALRQREETFRTRLNEELEAEVRQARREIDDVIADLKTKTDVARCARRSRPALTTGDTGAMRAEARAAARRHRQQVRRAVAVQPAQAEPAGRRTGDRRSRPGRRARPRRRRHVGSRRHGGPRRARQTHARAPSRPASRRASGGGVCIERERARRAAAARRQSDRPERDRLHASTKRITRAERFLDESLLTDQRTVRVIHGYGTGQLKRALAGFLQQHPLVASFGAAPPDKGGGGVTVVELKD